jgi:hypothetical protein
MVNRVTVIVNQVNPLEINRLNAEIESLRYEHYQEDIVNQLIDDEFVVSLSPATLPEIKETLRALLKIVNPDRILIET